VAECFIPSEGFETLYNRLNEEAQKERRRLAYLGSIEVTPYCNLKCRHCYVTQSKLEGEVFSGKELCRVIDEIAEEGCLWLLLTGGEPLMRPDFSEIYSRAKKQGIFTTVFTNGTLVTREIARLFHDLPPQAVEISLYGATRATYESITGVSGSFERCLRGIELLLEEGVKLKLKTMLMTLNKHEYWEMKKLAKSYGVDFRLDPFINPGLDGSRQPCNFRLTPEEIIEMDLADPERRQAWEDAFNNPRTLPPPDDTIFTCGAGNTRFHIDGFGRLQMCIIAREPSYDLRQGSFREGWRAFLAEIRSRKLSQPSPCRSCQYRDACMVCPGWAQLEYGNPEERPIEYLCDVARLRVNQFAVKKATINETVDK
jgi:radical SAM protein with 4Fe4S-binding SPASM domain